MRKIATFGTRAGLLGIAGLTVILTFQGCGNAPTDSTTPVGETVPPTNMVTVAKNVTGYRYDYFIDKFEAGCKATTYSTDGTYLYNAGGGTFANPAQPANCGSSNEGDVCYMRGAADHNNNGFCFLRKGGQWVAANNLSGADLAKVYTPDPGYPPLSYVSQTKAIETCQQVTVSYQAKGQSLTATKVLPTQMMWFIASSWTSDWRALGDSDQAAKEGTSGTSADLSGTPFPCNTYGMWGAGGNGTGLRADTGLGTYKTGSTETSGCTSYFGVQDMVGNQGEWINETVTSTTSICGDYRCVRGNANGIDDLWKDLGENAWGYYSGSGTSFYPSGWDFDHALLTATGTAGVSNFNGDMGYVAAPNPNITYGAFSGGTYTSGSRGGRYTLLVKELPANIYRNLGFRCAALMAE